LQARIDFPPSNAEIAEILSREASEASYVLQHAYRRAAGNLNSSISPLAAALAAKIPPERIVNFMPLKELRAWVEKVRDAEARRARTKTK
jgi:hypothetical protein